jgi:hypothetical protein
VGMGRPGIGMVHFDVPTVDKTSGPSSSPSESLPSSPTTTPGSPPPTTPSSP